MGKARGRSRNKRISNDSDIKGIIRKLQSNTDATREPINGPPNFSAQSHLRTRGGIMTGHIGFIADVFAISSGNLDLTVNSASKITLPPPDVYMSPESGTTDTLDTIDTGGIEFVGMRIMIRGVTGNTITITHGTASSNDLKGINCPNDVDYVLTGDNSVELGWDVVAAKFAIIGDDGSGGAGGTFRFNEIDLGNVSGGVNVDWSLGEKFRCILVGTTTFTFINTPDDEGEYQQIILEAKQDGTGGRTVAFADTFENDHTPIVGKEPDEYNVWAFYGSGRAGGPIFSFNTFQSTALVVALSDEDSPLNFASSSTPAVSFRMPYPMIVTEVKASVRTATSGSVLTCDIHEAGTTILSTKITIDDGETTSATATTPPIISDNELANDGLIELFMDSRDSGASARGLKLTIFGYIS